MARFNDAAGDSWEIDVTAGTVKDIRASELKVDLGKPDEGSPPLIVRVNNDVEFLVDLLHEICRGQCEVKGLKPIEFARRLKGQALYQAHGALKESWSDFFRPLRPDLAEVIQLGAAWADRLARTRLAKLTGPEYEEAIDKALAAAEAVLDEELAKAPDKIREAMLRPGRSAASSQPLPDATPGREPSES